MRTLADLKREAASGKIRFEMVERYGKTGDAIPKRCRGIRTVEKVNTDDAFTSGLLCITLL